MYLIDRMGSVATHYRLKAVGSIPHGLRDEKVVQEMHRCYMDSGLLQQLSRVVLGIHLANGVDDDTILIDDVGGA